MPWEYYNPNPVQTDGVGDCSVRAIAKALDISWEKAFALLSVNAFLMGDVISADVVCGSVLRQHGFIKEIVPNTCPDCYTVKDFCEDHPNGTFVVKSQDHVATVVNGTLFDSWPSENKIVIYFWTNNKEEKQ